jgi:hypothetical protein
LSKPSASERFSTELADTKEVKNVTTVKRAASRENFMIVDEHSMPVAMPAYFIRTKKATLGYELRIGVIYVCLL